MTAKSAALIGFFAMLLLSALMLYRLIVDILNVTRGLVPADILFSAILYAFAAIAITIFLFIYQRK
jgi:hypothetical protein